ncbi:hypothetical protein [Actinomadura citrea]|uniref:hypothetical protein n=1 Tax=Actinomadura citrea TaxID=46158 RepID=UPI0015C7EDA4|nr:hypothetical protein [Actinomadura citrea]GGT78074.1 hypothetical protein GCM10010177_40690 [Actinomadura citrea]
MYGVVVLFELLIQQIGWAFNTLADPLASGLVTGAVGALVLAGCVMVKTRSLLPVRSLTAYDRVIVLRLAAGILVLNAAYPYGAQTLGMGTIITMSALGPLCCKGSNLWTVLRHRSEMPKRVLRNAALNIALRVVAFAGVMAVNNPLGEFRHFDKETVFGIACGVLGAWSFWNYLSCVYNDRYSLNERLRILAVADLFAVPFTALAVWGMSFVLGGGFSELSGKVLMLGSIAGILSFAVPTLIGAWVADKISEDASGVFYLFDSLMGTLVGFFGALAGVLSAVQAPDSWGWGGMALVLLAAIVAAKNPIIEVFERDDSFGFKEGDRSFSKERERPA